MPNVLGLSADHETNLRKLAHYLLALPRDYQRFNMRHFVVLSKCGTVACACGHGPQATGFQIRDWEGYHKYAERVFGISLDGDGFRLRCWLFDADWCEHDNTPHGAGRRILWTLANGVPANIQSAMRANPPLYAGWEDVHGARRPRVSGRGGTAARRKAGRRGRGRRCPADERSRGRRNRRG